MNRKKVYYKQAKSSAKTTEATRLKQRMGEIASLPSALRVKANIWKR